MNHVIDESKLSLGRLLKYWGTMSVWEHVCGLAEFSGTTPESIIAGEPSAPSWLDNVIRGANHRGEVGWGEIPGEEAEAIKELDAMAVAAWEASKYKQPNYNINGFMRVDYQNADEIIMSEVMPPKCRRVLAIHYMTKASMKDRFIMTGLPSSTYYDALSRGHRVFMQNGGNNLL